MVKWLLNPIGYDCARIAQQVVIIEKRPYLDADALPVQDDSFGFPQCCSGMHLCQLFWSDRFPPITSEPIATGCPFIDTRRTTFAM
jgi:hypothetical protein